MSKNHQGTPKPAYADWTVRLDRTLPDGSPLAPVQVANSAFTRDERDGYTFTDSKGCVTADFPPGTVQHVQRKDAPPDPMVVMVPYALVPETLRGINDALEHAGANARIGTDPYKGLGSGGRFDDDPRKRGTAAAVKSDA